MPIPTHGPTDNPGASTAEAPVRFTKGPNKFSSKHTNSYTPIANTKTNTKILSTTF